MAAIIVTGVALFFTLPFFARVKISYDAFRRYFFVKVYFFGVRIVIFRVLITDTIYFTFGKRVKKLDAARINRGHAKRLDKLSEIPLYFKGKMILIYGKTGEPEKTAFICGGINALIKFSRKFFLEKGINFDDITVMPAFNGDVFNLRLDFTVIGTPLKIFSWLL